jgi:hypothetical protein
MQKVVVLLVLVLVLPRSLVAFAMGKSSSFIVEDQSEVLTAYLTAEAGPDRFCALPPELQVDIFQYLNYWDRYHLAQVNKRMRGYLCTPAFPCSLFYQLEKDISQIQSIRPSEYQKISKSLSGVIAKLSSLEQIFLYSNRLNVDRIKELNKETLQRLKSKLVQALEVLPEASYFDLWRDEKVDFLKKILKLPLLDLDLRLIVSDWIRTYEVIYGIRAGEGTDGEFWQSFAGKSFHHIPAY